MLNYLYVTSIVSICVLLYEVSISVFTCLFQMAFAFFIELQNSLHIKSIRFFSLIHVLSPGCGLRFAFNADLFGFVFIFYGFVGVRNEVRIIFYFLFK